VAWLKVGIRDASGGKMRGSLDGGRFAQVTWVTPCAAPHFRLLKMASLENPVDGYKMLPQILKFRGHDRK
jgi:hypothetical protein